MRVEAHARYSSLHLYEDFRDGHILQQREAIIKAGCETVSYYSYDYWDEVDYDNINKGRKSPCEKCTEPHNVCETCDLV